MTDEPEESPESTGELRPEAAPGTLQRSPPWLPLGAVFVGSLLAGLVLSWAVERATGTSRVLRGVAFQGVALSGLDEAQVHAALEPQRRALARRKLAFVVDTQRFELEARQLGLGLDVPALTRAALSAGRTGSWPRQFGFWMARLFSLHDLPREVSVERIRALEQIRAWQEQALPPPNEPRIFFDQKLEVVYPEVSISIDLGPLLAALPARLEGPPATPHVVPLLRTAPVVSREEVDARLREAKQLLAQPLLVSTADGAHQLELHPRELGPALETAIDNSHEPHFVLGLSAEKLKPAFARVRAELEKPAQPARFSVDGAHRVTILPSQTGLRIDEAGTHAEILKAGSSPERKAELRLRIEEPQGLTQAEAEALGIKGLVAQFTTHHPCCEARVKNIQSVARQVDGIVLAPGEQFSLNGLLGPRTNEGGYFEAPTIVRGKMKQTAGGGISQFATTLFNAVLDGGYEIIQRQPHSFYFPRYPEGHEATVSFPSPDLIFKNDTKFGLLLKTAFGPTFIRVLIYGDNEGRRVERRISKRFNSLEPPLEYAPNPELPPEKSQLVTRGQTGWTVTATRVVFFADGTRTEQTRDVVYQPRPHVVEVHPCNIPKGMKGHTGERCPEPPALEEEAVAAQEGESAGELEAAEWP